MLAIHDRGVALPEHSLKLQPPVSIVVPAFNEEKAIASVTASLAEHYPEYEIIVVDDGSQDHTAQLVDRERCRLIRHQMNRGYGASWKTGARNALGEIVVFFDGDGQFQVEDVGRAVDKLRAEDCDIVFAVRRQGAGDPLIRRPGKAILSSVANFLARKKIRDLNCGLRAVKRNVLLRYLHLLPDGFSASTTSTLVFIKRGYRIGEIEITTQKRIGSSSVRIVRDGLGTVLLILRIIALFDPMRIFLPTAALLMAFATVYSLYEAFASGLGVPVLGAVLFIGGMTIFFMGIICDQISAVRLERFEDPFSTRPE